jgi:multidrug efflux pump subunit AcrB
MNIATWSIRNPLPVVLAFMLLALAGLHGFNQLPIKNLPELELPTVNVALQAPGTAPVQLEAEVARPVEEAIRNAPGLRHVRTTVVEGLVQITAEFDIGKTLQDAMSEVKESVDRIHADLPANVRPPAYSADVLGSDPVVTYVLSLDPWDEAALSWFVDDTLSKALLAVPGVGRVERIGGMEREIRAEVDPARLAAMDLTIAELSHGLRQVQLDGSGGTARMGGREFSSRTLGAAAQIAELESMPLPLPSGQSVRLGDLVTLVDAARDRAQTAMLDGRPVVGFNVYRTKGKDETLIAAEVARAVAALQQAHPGLRGSLVASAADYTKEQYRGSMQMLWEGSLLATLVVGWFLRDWRATMVAAVALPLSILPAFALMPLLGFSLNTLTLLALAVVAGILVDDAIVEIENIERHRRMGKGLLQATSDAVSEISLAVTATTLTLVVVFLPTAMMPGIGGMLFRQFGWTAVISILASLLVARFLTPLLAVRWLGDAPTKHAQDGRWMRVYLCAMDWCLSHRHATLAAGSLFLAASFCLVLVIPTGFIPPSDKGFFQVTVELPPGASIMDSHTAVERVRRAVADVEGIDHVFSIAGDRSGGDQASDVRRSMVTLSLSPRDSREAQAVIEGKVSEALRTVPGARFSVDGGNGTQISLILTSGDVRALTASAQALAGEMRSVPGLLNVNSTASLDRPELIARPDAVRAAEAGVSTAAIAETLRVALDGDFDEDLPRFNVDRRQLLIRVRLADAQRSDLKEIGQLRVRSVRGLIPLESVAELTFSSSPQRIERYDLQRYVTVTAGLGGLSLGEAESRVTSLPAVQSMPEGVSLLDDGDGELASELASSFVSAAVTAVLCMFCVLVLLFRDLLQPLTILSVVPLSLGGAFVALWMTDTQLDVPAMIGLVMLMGVVAKNSILLIDYAATHMRQEGKDAATAVRDACRMRARPIVMTTIAMVAGMLPIALGFGSDASFRQPMAIAVIGGLMISTYLSLLLVPVLFLSSQRLQARIRRADQAEVQSA